MPPPPKPKKMKLKRDVSPKAIAKYKNWDLLKHGVSQSLLQKFISCRDRFHIASCRALKPTDRSEAMEYGSIYHKLIEWGAEMGTKYSHVLMHKKMLKYLQKNYPSPESKLLGDIALAQFAEYKKWEATLPTYKYIAQEPVFAEKFPLPACNFKCEAFTMHIPATKLILRGRIDEVIEHDGELWLQENKTKGQINIQMLMDTIPENLQVMFYATAAQLKYGRKVAGIIYNVIRKPGQRQRQKEGDKAFVERIQGEIQNDHNYYFKRIQYKFPPGSVEKWQREELIPLLYHVYMWWMSIKSNPTQPWVDENGEINPLHGRRSFGVYEPTVFGKGDFFDLIIHGRKNGLIEDNNMFPELEDDD